MRPSVRRGARLLLASLALACGLAAGSGAALSFENAGYADRLAAYRADLARAGEGAYAGMPDGELLERVTAAFDASDFRTAAGLLEAYLIRHPDRADAWLSLAETLERTDPYSGRALAAAYAAYTLAASDKERSQALPVLARSMARWGDGRAAIDVMAEAVAIAPTEDNQAYLAELQDRYGFRIWGANVRNDTDIPAICVEFSDPLADIRRINYADFVAIEPATPIEPILSGNRLCLEGVDFGQRYTVTIRPGIESREGLRLLREDVFEVTVDDRPPTTAFYGQAYVLPRTGEGTLPLTTVNVDEVVLRLIRINDRNLVPQVVDGAIGEMVWSWNVDDLADTDGVEVWTGRMAVSGETNIAKTTGVPVDVMLPEPEPGVYVLSARDARLVDNADQYWEDTPPATQWLVVTDLGLATFAGLDGLTVAVRSLDSALPVEGTRLVLVARNNTVLAEATSGPDGLATFPAGVMRGQGGARPAVVMAYGEGDFTFLELTGPAFDLSDRGVSGRTEPGPLDAYLYTDRGVYRPGEAVALTALLRDERAHALPGLPLTIRLLRPDGIEAQVLQLADEGGGGHTALLALPATAYTGVWTAEAYVDPDGAPVGSVRFQVEDFVPARLRVGLTSESPVLREARPTEVALSAAFLYGAPAARLATEAELTIRPAETPWPEYAGWSFGLVQDEPLTRIVGLAAPETDEAGVARFTVDLGALPDTTRPLEAVVRGAVFDTGGRPAGDSIVLPIRRDRPSIGLRAEGGLSVPEGATAVFEALALDPEGERTALGLDWVLIRETRDYQWYTYGDVWEYDVILREQVIEEGTAAVRADGVARIEARVDWGTYRLDVWNAESGAASSLRFSAGWWMSEVADPTPDKLDVALDAESYRAGDTLTVHIDAPFAGEALVMVANDRVLASRNVTLGGDGATVEIPVGSDWGAGAYVLATAFRPDATPGERVMGPARAVGLRWFGIDVRERTLDVAIGAPDEVLPRQIIEVPIAVSGAAEGEPVYLTLAAVDEGILLLTDFASPDPTRHYFGRRALGLDLRDAYGRLIVSRGERGNPRVGGDAGADQRLVLPERSTQTIALFSGIVRPGPDGRVTIPITIPDFAGELRLMAVAWSAAAIGAADAPLLVRDPVVAELVTPRFLAPGDTAQLAFTLRNLSGPTGAYTVEIDVDAPLRATADTVLERSLDTGEELRAVLPVTADAIGVGRIRAAVTGPDGFAVAHEWALSVRAPQPMVTERMSSVLAPGETAVWDAELLRSFVPGTVTVSGSVSNRPAIDIAGLIRELDGYPYGCLEQTTSRAMPLLYVADLAERIGEEWRPDDLRRRVQDAIDRVLTMQMPGGAFGVWSPFSQQDVWLSAYATDFLLRAREQGYRVPDRPLREALRFLSGYLDSWEARDTCNPLGAYVLYVAARGGAANVGAMRTLLDACLPSYPTAIARAFAGAAAAQFGDAGRAETAFALAMATDRPAVLPEPSYYDYGSPVRDQAAVATLMAEAGRPLDEVLDMADRAAEGFARHRWHSTQELAWMVLAAEAALVEAGPVEVAIDGRATTGEGGVLTFLDDPDDLASGVTVANVSDEAVRSVVTLRGIPAKPQPATSDGFEIERILIGRDGTPIDPTVTSIAQGDLVTVLIRGRSTDQLDHRALIVDLLPAGFEIENPELGDAAELGDIDATLSYPVHTEMRDDRYVAAIDFYAGGDRSFALAYLARAVTPGSFVLPPALVEDMYAPEISGRTAMGRITIVGR